MTAQLTLLPDTTSKLEAAYRRWRAAEPAIYDLFVRFARQMLARDRRFGMKLLAERVRWEVKTTWGPDEQGFKLNNNHTAYIARDLLRELPELLPLLETRRLAAESPSDEERAARRRNVTTNRRHLEPPHA